MSYNPPFYFLRTLWGELCHADWDAAAARGPFALVAEFFRAVSGLNAWPFFVPLAGDWRPSASQPILRAHGIASWGWGKHKDELVFQVKLRQATWAQYLLQQHGVPLSGQLLDVETRSTYRPGPRRALRPAPAARVMPAALAPAPDAESRTSLLRDPVGEINRAVDRLAKW